MAPPIAQCQKLRVNNNNFIFLAQHKDTINDMCLGSAGIGVTPFFISGFIMHRYSVFPHSFFPQNKNKLVSVI